jgi:two-component system sensor histidine kinase DesK
MELLPDDYAHGWARYVWLVYFGFFFIDPIMSHAGWHTWLATAGGTVVFLALYAGFFHTRCPRNFLFLVGMVVAGLIYAPFNAGASTFFIYAACFIPFAVQTERSAIKLLAILSGIVTAEFLLLHLPFVEWFYGAVFSAVLGAGNIFFAQRNRANARLRLANKEIENLAKVAERERIARDLHDVLGHTLSVIILKSELAGKLIERDPERAKAEMRDVEQTSRQALAEVRSTIRGYRVNTLEAEMKTARSALETAGVEVNAQTAPVTLSPSQESVVALVLREAVTNVVRHAQARHCLLRIMPINGSCVLQVEDDGRGGEYFEGSGLRGMRERIEALGGTLARNTAAGTHLTIKFPLAGADNGGQ